MIVRIYDFLKQHKQFRLLSLLLLTLALAAFTALQTYKEDISDFLPLNSNYHKAIGVYQDISGANRIIAIFQQQDTTQASPDTITQVIDRFITALERNDKDHLLGEVTYQIDMEKLTGISDFVYQHIPYFLTEQDYVRFDSLLNNQEFIDRQIAADKQLLMLPMSGLLSTNMGNDPLNFFTPVVEQLQQSAPTIAYENYDGYIFTADMQRAIVMLTSPFGSSETEKNSQLMALLQQCADDAKTSSVAIHFTGGPAIAVGNANQIKTDSLLAVSIAVVLIVALLFVVFRKLRNLLLIVLSVAWGWLFAMGCLAIVRDNVSIIVIGMSSIILGIAVNYPLHLIAHLQHTPDIRQALREIVKPLLVGNITTVGAFLALVPMHSIALRDLGIFSALLLVGTIFFVLIYLPHLVKTDTATTHEVAQLNRISSLTLEDKRWLVAVVLILTIIFGYFSFDTKFDSNISHINYMTDEQRADLEYISTTSSTPNTPLDKSSLARQEHSTLYLVSTGTTLNEALERSEQVQPLIQQLSNCGAVSQTEGPQRFVSSKAEQERRLQLWQSFLQTHQPQLEQSLLAAAKRQGFTPESFSQFTKLLHTTFQPQEPSYFNLLATTVYPRNIIHHDNEYSVVTMLTGDTDTLNSKLSSLPTGSYTFDVEHMNASIANSLSNDFNYIGWVCGAIVFFFLWFSFRNIKLAIISFIPMAVSWLWILGIMTLLDIQFNVVNVILATFIFGQGDDYTIFITEGCLYEHVNKRPMLASYKNSIIISAVIMFIGIGVLILAKHPALYSLAQVTIVGMSSVVLMAWLLPPLLFKWLIHRKLI